MLRHPVLLGLLLLLPACDSDNVHWAFVSNPGGTTSGSGGGVIVIVRGNSAAATLGESLIRIRGTDDRGAVDVVLPYDGDLAVLDRGTSVELRSPALLPPRVDLEGARLGPPAFSAACLLVRVADASRLHPAMAGPGSLHAASAGTLLVLESSTGMVVFGEQPQPEVVPLSVTLTTTSNGEELALLLPDGRLRRLIAPPAPTAEQRMAYDPARNSIRLLGPTGEALAEIPAENATLRHGLGGLFLTAVLPAGLPREPVPMTLLTPRGNRYLLRINES